MFKFYVHYINFTAKSENFSLFFEIIILTKLNCRYQTT